MRAIVYLFQPAACCFSVAAQNAFHCNVDERKMRAMADALVSTGLAKAGYNFVNIDGKCDSNSSRNFIALPQLCA